MKFIRNNMAILIVAVLLFVALVLVATWPFESVGNEAPQQAGSIAPSPESSPTAPTSPSSGVAPSPGLSPTPMTTLTPTPTSNTTPASTEQSGARLTLEQSVAQFVAIRYDSQLSEQQWLEQITPYATNTYLREGYRSSVAVAGDTIVSAELLPGSLHTESFDNGVHVSVQVEITNSNLNQSIVIPLVMDWTTSNDRWQIVSESL